MTCQSVSVYFRTLALGLGVRGACLVVQFTQHQKASLCRPRPQPARPRFARTAVSDVVAEGGFDRRNENTMSSLIDDDADALDDNPSIATTDIPVYPDNKTKIKYDDNPASIGRSVQL